MLAVMPAILILAVIPWAGPFELGKWSFTPYFAVAPGVNVGVLFILAITSIGVYGIALAGWASNSKYAVLGGIRTSAQMISYELALGLSVLPPVMLANYLDLGQIVEAQKGCGLFWLTHWPPLFSTSGRWRNYNVLPLTCWKQNKNFLPGMWWNTGRCVLACSSWPNT